SALLSYQSFCLSVNPFFKKKGGTLLNTLQNKGWGIFGFGEVSTLPFGGLCPEVHLLFKLDPAELEHGHLLLQGLCGFDSDVGFLFFSLADAQFGVLRFILVEWVGARVVNGGGL
ncbi:hypothetical protein GS597_18405, partial [Synechococcales cyanobacterium C]